MALTVEDGTVVAGADSYLSVADANEYHQSRGNTAWLDLAGVIDGTVQVDGGHAAGVTGVLITADASSSFSLLAGDQISFDGGTTYYVVTAATGAVGNSGSATVSISPSLRSAVAGAAFVTLGETVQEAALRYATRWLDERYIWRGSRSTHVGNVERLDWPRSRVWTDDERKIPADIVPVALKQATAEVALEHANEALNEVRVRGGFVLAHGVGALFQQFSRGAPGGRTYPYVDQLLRDLIVCGPNRALMIRG